ncbi:hypothetical protein AB4089_08650 [Arthrobacter sp. 2MCAF15]|uniref:hypothetical protein n=1 Tax=Arthrobacter sp. 2MCAF15 TaxID=3232984 RepID=UPI003F92F105
MPTRTDVTVSPGAGLLAVAAVRLAARSAVALLPVPGSSTPTAAGLPGSLRGRYRPGRQGNSPDPGLP